MAISGRHRLLVACVIVFLITAGAATAAKPKVRGFSADEAVAVGLDEILTFQCRSRVNPRHLGPERFRIAPAEGAAEGIPVRGEFVRGTFLVDPDTGGVVVVDPDQIGPRLIAKIERRGRVELIPREIRYDLGASSKMNGARQVLIDRRKRKTVMFVPDLPVREDLADSAYAPAEIHDVEVGKQGRKRNYRSSFRTLADDDSMPFTGTFEGQLRLVNSRPEDGGVASTENSSIYLRFSRPIDPRTVRGNILLEIASESGSPQAPIDTELRQTLLGKVELVVMPQEPLPASGAFELTILTGLSDLRGDPIAPTLLKFTTE